MAHKIGKCTIITDNAPSIAGCGTAVGPAEGSGPLKQWYDNIYDDLHMGQKSWEAAESALMSSAVSTAIVKSGISRTDIDAVFAGDLLDQSIASTFALKSFNIPAIGLFGACSTMALSLALAAVCVDSSAMETALAATVSHFCTAERQFRFPLEYGSKRTPTSQKTVTGSGAAVVSRTDTAPYLLSVLFGKIKDYDIKDANNMGAAMAPAAADTFMTFFNDTKTSPSDYDLLLTGDIGSVGSQLLYRLTEEKYPDFEKKHNDCGLMIYDMNNSSVAAGGSGCGCSGAVLCSYIYEQLRAKKLDRVLFCGTGALMSPTSTQQGLTIPAVAHLVELSGTKQHLGC